MFRWGGGVMFIRFGAMVTMMMMMMTSCWIILASLGFFLVFLDVWSHVAVGSDQQQNRSSRSVLLLRFWCRAPHHLTLMLNQGGNGTEKRPPWSLELLLLGADGRLWGGAVPGAPADRCCF